MGSLIAPTVMAAVAPGFASLIAWLAPESRKTATN